MMTKLFKRLSCSTSAKNITRVCIAILCMLMHSEKALANNHYLTGEYFNESPSWASYSIQHDESASPFEHSDQFKELDTQGGMFITPISMAYDLENSRSQLQSKVHYGDVKVKLAFKLATDSDLDIMLMSRYPVRLSTQKNTSGLTQSGAIAASWDEYWSENPNRLFAGSKPKTSIDLKAEQWHEFEARFRAPRFDEAHNKVDSALFLSVKINGVLVQENILVPLPAKNAAEHWESEFGPLAFDAILGQAMIAKVQIWRADYGRVKLPKKSGGTTNELELIDHVSSGQSLFKSYGCAECHSVAAQDTSVKTGPNLYALFTRDIRTRWVENQEKHRYEVRADLNYLTRSVRNAEAELAIAESGVKKNQAYLPIMPRYNQETIPEKDLSAIYAYLQTLNNHWQQGAMEVLETTEGPAIYDPIKDPMQFVVQERVRIQRGPLTGVSGRAIHVGHPNGIHYSFDPRNLSLSKLWQGGFLETSGELTGRGGNGFKIGYKAIESNFGGHDYLLQPLNKKGKAINFDFKEPKFGDLEALKRNTYSPSTLEEKIAKQDAKFKGYFRDSTQPLTPVTFFFTVGQNQLNIAHEFEVDGRIKIKIAGVVRASQAFKINEFALKDIKVNKGTIENGVWILPKSQHIQATLDAQVVLADIPWLAQQAGVKYERQAKIVKSASAQLPPGYKIESWVGPKDNMGREQLFEAMGLDVAPNGDVLVSTRTAGVWRLRDEHWHLFAEGIFDSLGIVNESENGDVAVVGSKAELTRIRDINGDGIADYYDTLFDTFTNGSDYHTYTHGPVKDADGHYIIALNLGNGPGAHFKADGGVMGSHGGYSGWAFRIAPDGSYQTFGNGLRSPAGLGVDPDGNVWYADNQGDYMGSSKIFNLQSGKFYGHPASLIDEPNMTPDSPEIAWNKVVKRKERAPIVIAHGKVANSPGSLVWDLTKGEFGQFSRNAFIGDQTQSNLSRVYLEKVDEEWQGVMMPFGSGMESGVMKPIFLPDNSLLLGQTGRGWHAKGGNATALQRITYDGMTDHLAIKEVSITHNGFVLRLTQPLPQILNSTNFETWLKVESWTYRDAPDYGSEELAFMENNIKSVVLDNKHSTITLELADPSIPRVHAQQTGRIFHISLTHDSLEKTSGSKQMHAYYSAQRFR